MIRVLALVLLLAALGCGGGGSVEGGRATTPGLAGTANLRLRIDLADRVSASTSSSNLLAVRVEVRDRQTGSPVVTPVQVEIPAGSSGVEVPVLGVSPGFRRVSAVLLQDGQPVGDPAVADVEVVLGQTTRVSLSLSGSGTLVTREFVVAANAGGDNLTVFQADLTTSTLAPVPGSPFSTGSGTAPDTLAFDPAGEFFYVTLAAADHVAQYRLDPVTGIPSFVSQAPTGDRPAGNAMDPLGRFLFAANLNDGTISGYALDPVTGGMTEVPGSPFSITGGVAPQTVYVEPLGRFLYAGEGNLISQMYAFAIDPSTGSLSQVGGPVSAGPPGNRVFGFQATPSGDVLYATGSFQQILGFDVNPSTGALTPKAGFPVAETDALGGMALDTTRNVLYIAGFFNNGVHARPVNPDGTLGSPLAGTPVGTGGTNPILMALNPTREALYVSNVDQLSNPSMGTVSAFRLASGGSPAPVAGNPFAGGAFTFGIGVARYTVSQ